MHKLSEFQVNNFKRQLKSRYMELRNEIREELLSYDNQQYRELAGAVHDSGDESVADLLVDINLASIDRHVHEINDIDAALMRIAEGHYGICIECDSPIAFKRLLVYPAAKRCIVCQTLYERTYAARITPDLEVNL
ncbi:MULTISPECIES: TraR/DksA family transcriptional regulator [unclassified Methylobacter]|jgi:DnaK suppressor protein|uniref:TraR/DksA family transcriptional regulator n=1 Tax=unclassified Methylobacter TaxID=2635283 RepID=UPI00189408C2|nr:TraR/DksA family transcriptional regulator [Methylobacter sp. BlB1]MBF6647365.1 TraR/DksA family transcriptional regulator [Methylobacter sp. BlB1]